MISPNGCMHTVGKFQNVEFLRGNYTLPTCDMVQVPVVQKVTLYQPKVHPSTFYQMPLIYAHANHVL